MDKNSFIPVNEPLLAGSEKKYVLECLESGWISSEGTFVRQFEEQAAAAFGRTHGVAVTNGSAALECAVAALKIGSGDEVIMPTFTIISCAAAIVRAGATPVLVDCDPITWNMDPKLISEKLTPRTKAILVVHIYGLPVDMDPIMEIARNHDLLVIEDAAEMQGQTYKGKPCGSFGDISIMSFYANKHITTGEGGMVLTNDDQLAERCRSLRNLCFGHKRFVHEELGWNMRMTNVQAAIGVAQLEQLPQSVKRKRQIGHRYRKLLADIPYIKLPANHTDYADNIYWVYGIVLNDRLPFDAALISEQLAAHNVGTRPFFWPMHEQPVFMKQGLFTGERYPVAEGLARRGLYLPSGLATTDEQIETVCKRLSTILAELVG